MPVVSCPDCCALLELPAGVESGDLVECPSCAGQAVRVREDGGGWSGTLAYRVSCPDCEQSTILPEDAQAEDTVQCCGRTYRLTFEYGAFAAEAV